MATKLKEPKARDAMWQETQNALLDRTLIRMNQKAYEAFLALLDAAPNPNDRLRKTLQSRAPWE